MLPVALALTLALAAAPPASGEELTPEASGSEPRGGFFRRLWDKIHVPPPAQPSVRQAEPSVRRTAPALRRAGPAIHWSERAATERKARIRAYFRGEPAPASAGARSGLASSAGELWDPIPPVPDELAGEPLASWMRGDHRRCLQAVMGNHPGRFHQGQLLAWLARHGDVPAIQAKSGYLPYSRRELRELKTHSSQGGVASAILLAAAHDEKSKYEWEPTSLAHVPAYIPWAIVMANKARAYGRRIRKNASRALRRLERR